MGCMLEKYRWRRNRGWCLTYRCFLSTRSKSACTSHVFEPKVAGRFFLRLPKGIGFGSTPFNAVDYEIQLGWSRADSQGDVLKHIAVQIGLFSGPTRKLAQSRRPGPPLTMNGEDLGSGSGLI